MSTSESSDLTWCQRSPLSFSSAARSPLYTVSCNRSASTWPPEKPMSTRRGLSFFEASIGLVLHGLDQLGQHAAGRLRMKKGYAAAADAHARLLVDQPQAGVAHRAQGP